MLAAGDRRPWRPKRQRWQRAVLLLTAVTTCQLWSSFVSAPQTTEAAESLPNVSNSTQSEEPETPDNRSEVEIRRCIDLFRVHGAPTALPAPKPTNVSSIPHDNAPHKKEEYPEDFFSVEERRQGFVLLHIFGMVYMFVALAIVCDEFFVPALGVITDKLQISDDVAGATFMAAGGSAPELFTSLIGVFISHSNVGIGTIVGSAVFNILFVIGMCALFSREILHLTWWPLFRDVSFYVLDLIMLIIFFLDNIISWWESLLLILGYASYVTFMKFNVQLEQLVKLQLNRHKNIVQVIAPEEVDQKNGPVTEESQRAQLEDNTRLKLRPALQRGGSSASLHNSTMRNTIFQLMIHTLDPLGEVAGCEEKPDVPKSVSVQVTPPEQDAEVDKEDKCEDDKVSDDSAVSESDEENSSSDDTNNDTDSSDQEEDEESEENEEPLSLEWPDSHRKQATYLFLLPIVFPLWLTLPDVRKTVSKKFFIITFLGSIVWIAVFSYLMVWWAHQVGETIGISEAIMGLTILAAGTSIPDLITSVIVARKGLGDMAVSSSVGSNIFDITVGLPVPWLLYSIFNGLSPVAVSSNGLFCAIVLLFFMLIFVISSIAVCKWKMSKYLGITMFGLYFIFLIISVLLEDRIIICPVSI
ncbi:sodium/potassium/calcium exchanger 1 isoform X2 [Erpetoichthys calabaricus]|uniref:sodium/potassium/calcium exchanger 1 isoform X2 n=1 Tax=Erpetoichthys calabaricus TaxID=27687 RepID=UPI002234E9D6|nr:sodium/potassium/calcium exchanger 1 isoform X2 [Erpetoichthys calabaricus]